MIRRLVWQFWQGMGARLALACCALLLAALPLRAERVALVVGNADYVAAPSLKNPINDATAVADTLKRLGFKVTLMTDAGGTALWDELDRFSAAAETADSAVFFYSGHAFQMSGVNYLVPVSAKLTSREGAKEEAWSLDGIIARLQSRSRQTLIFLDACRNDPLPAAVRGSGAAADGLARVQTGAGTFVAFATEPGGVTADGIEGAEHSPFTTALLKHMETEGISISDMMIEVRNDVENATLRKQLPWDQSSLREQFYFVPPATVNKQELSEADYELFAQLSAEDRKKFLDVLRQSGFDEASLQAAEAAIAISEANLEQVASQSTIIGAPVAAEAAPQPAATTATEVVAAPVTEPAAAPETQVAAAEPVADPLAGLEVVDTGVTIGDVPTGPMEVAVADANAPIRLAALNWDTRDIAINEVTISRLRLVGRQVSPDSEADRALLAAIDPRLLEGDAIAVVAPEDLAGAVQSELKRVGCYQMAVDGSWGKGSRTALTSYFLAKKVVPDSLEPTDVLYQTLKTESQVVCTVRVAKSAVQTGNRATAEASSKKVSGDMNSTKVSGKKAETGKTRATKAAIGMSGGFN